MIYKIRNCPYCKEDIYIGDWFFEYWDNSFTCDHTDCVLKHISPDELSEYAIEYCVDNIKDFAEYISLSRWLQGDWSVSLSDILSDADGSNLTIEYCQDSGLCFVDWLEKEDKITRRDIYEKV